MLPAGDHLLPAGSSPNEQFVHVRESFEYLPSAHKRQALPLMSGTEPGLQMRHEVWLVLGWYMSGAQERHTEEALMDEYVP